MVLWWFGLLRIPLQTLSHDMFALSVPFFVMEYSHTWLFFKVFLASGKGEVGKIFSWNGRSVKIKSEKFNSSAGLMSNRVSVGKGGVWGRTGSMGGYEGRRTTLKDKISHLWLIKFFCELFPAELYHCFLTCSRAWPVPIHLFYNSNIGLRYKEKVILVIGSHSEKGRSDRKMFEGNI